MSYSRFKPPDSRHDMFKEDMGRMKFRPVFLVFSLGYLFLFCIFYFKYVPLVRSFQIVLVPLLVLILVLTSIRVKWGILFFVFIFPLFNNLPYFFGIQQGTPHAPVALVLFLAFFLGWLLNHSVSSSGISFNHSLFRPLVLFSLIALASAVITFFRYLNFFPFVSDRILELVVNVNYVRSGGALMSDLFNLLNYLSGFLFFFIAFNSIHSKKFVKRILVVLSASFFLSLLFSLVQIFFSKEFGNTSYWVAIEQINSTYKDPNSFALVLSAMVPMLLGAVFLFRKRFKIYFLS